MDSDKKRNKVNIWLVLGVIVLIALLLMWLADAFVMGDTDVAAFIAPQIG